MDSGNGTTGTSVSASRTRPPRATRPRGSYANGRATRQDVLDAAMALFAEVGYRSASLREVATRVGISHSGLLHHFGSKSGLLTAVLARRDEIDQAAIDADVDAGQDVLSALVHVVERNADSPQLVQLFATLSAEATAPDHPAHAYFQQRYAELVERVEAHLVELASAGRLRAGADPAAGARVVVATMDGLQVQWLLARASGGAVDMAAGLRALLATLVVPA